MIFAEVVAVFLALGLWKWLFPTEVWVFPPSVNTTNIVLNNYNKLFNVNTKETSNQMSLYFKTSFKHT